MAKTTNKDLIQSYILTTAKYDFNVYEKRILYRLVESLQYVLEGKKLVPGFSINKSILGDLDFTMPISVFLKNEEDENYSRIKQALLSLNKKIIEFEDNEQWSAFNIIERPNIKNKNGSVSFRLAPLIYEAFVDFSKGFRKYELEIAMQFDSVYAMRFYELLSGQKKPLTYTIEHLKKMFGVSNKYKYIKDFRIKVLETAKRELDKCSPYTFDFEMNKTGRAFTSVTFYPKFQPQFRDSELEKRELQKQVSPSWDLSKNILDYLRTNFDFEMKEIKQNIDLFKLAHSQLDLIQFMADVKARANRAKNPKGYIIGALKKQIQ